MFTRILVYIQETLSSLYVDHSSSSNSSWGASVVWLAVAGRRDIHPTLDSSVSVRHRLTAYIIPSSRSLTTNLEKILVQWKQPNDSSILFRCATCTYNRCYCSPPLPATSAAASVAIRILLSILTAVLGLQSLNRRKCYLRLHKTHYYDNLKLVSNYCAERKRCGCI